MRDYGIELSPLLEKEVFDQWAPVLKETDMVNENVDAERLSLMTKIAHNQALAMNEADGGLPNNANLVGMGNPSFGTTLGGQNSFVTGDTGSGDKWGSPFAIAMQVAAKTVGFDIVNTIPISQSAGMIHYVDYLYADGKLDGVGTEAPTLFKINVTDFSSFSAAEGDKFFGTSTGTTAIAATGDATGNAAYLEYVGPSRKTGYPIFKLISTGTFENDDYTKTDTLTLAQIFDGDAGMVAAANEDEGTNSLTVSTPKAVTASAEYVVAMEDNVYGYANGAGGQAGVQYSGNWMDGLNLNEAARRGEGESDDYKDMGMRVTSKYIECGTFKVSISVTQEQLQDMKRNFGYDIVSKAQNALVNETSQSINRNIISRAFALGWTNHLNSNVAEGVNFNLALDPTYTTANVNATYKKNDNTNGSLVIPVFGTYSSASASAETQDSNIKRIVNRIIQVSNFIAHRGRLGGATGIVTNGQVAAALQSVANYSAASFDNKLGTPGSLYPAGSILGMTIYVDPNMKWNDNRVCVFRKGTNDDPGLKFLPYVLAESVSVINPNTAAPRLFVMSRYALTEYGQHPEMQYVTFYIKAGTNGLG
jgi:hypothetical protein